MRSNKTLGFPLFAPVQRTMQPLFERASNLTEIIIGAAIEVHRDKGARPDRIHLRMVFGERI